MPRKKDEVASTENQSGFTDQVLQKWISFPRVTVIDETDNAYMVEFDGMKYEVAKCDTGEVKGGAYDGGEGEGRIAMDTRHELRQVLVPASGIFSKKNIPSEFREAVAFHELRHVEYGGDDDAHQKALHDEILYIIKYFSAELRERYLKFARRLRDNLSPLEEGKENGNVIRVGTKFYATFECLKEMFPNKDDLLLKIVQRVPCNERGGQIFYQVDTVEQLVLAPEIREKYLKFMKDMKEGRRRPRPFLTELEILERKGSFIKIEDKKYATSVYLEHMFDAGYHLILSAAFGAKRVQRGPNIFYDVEHVEKVFLESDDLSFVAHRAKFTLPEVDYENVLRINGNEYMLPEDLAKFLGVSTNFIRKIIRNHKLQPVSGRDVCGEVHANFYNVAEIRKILSESDVSQIPHADKDGVIMHGGKRYRTNSRLAYIFSEGKLPSDITRMYKMVRHAEKNAGLKPIKGFLHGHLKEFYDEDAVKVALQSLQNT